MTKFSKWSIHGLISSILYAFLVSGVRAAQHNSWTSYWLTKQMYCSLASSRWTKLSLWCLQSSGTLRRVAGRGDPDVMEDLAAYSFTPLRPTVTPLKCSPHDKAFSHTSALSTFNVNISNPDSGVRLWRIQWS